MASSPTHRHGLYPKNSSGTLDPELFRAPTSEYRGVPFWSWNNRLDREQLLRQIGWLQDMGFGGFNVHPRTGLATTYLSAEFFDLVRACTEEAKRRGMFCWLYDEDRWPSGYAGGFVTEDPAHRQRHLLWTPRAYDPTETKQAINNSGAFGGRSLNGRLLGRYEVTLRGGYLADHRRLADGESPGAGANVWYAYVESATPVSWFNHQTYVDTLSPKAMRRFIDVTHERYREELGGDFGGAIPAIFTDEPQFVRKGSLDRADQQRDVTVPWTEDFESSYLAAYGERIEDALPEVFFDLPDGRPSVARYRYHDHATERFANAFAKQIGAWCDRHGIALTGHMMEEPTLESQTHSIGEAMRSLASFQLPGIDMLCDRMELTTAKQAQSVAHQYARDGVISELYGVTNWDFDFVGHKAQGDWQAAMGVSVRVPHLAWVSMAGEAKRDYPASIFYQSPWFREYPLIEDHFARLAVALTRGTPVVRVGVVHPIESFWLAYGPREQTQGERGEREAAFLDLAHWLLFGLIDYDYLCESLLPSQCDAKPAPTLGVGAMAYDAVLVPPMRTIRATTLDRLDRFIDGGGQVVFAGEIPSLVNAVPSDRAQKLAERARQVPFSRLRILDALAGRREVDITLADGSRSGAILHQLRQDGDRRLLFLCNTDRQRGAADTRIRVAGAWRPSQLDTFRGNRGPVSVDHVDGATVVPWDFTPHGHVLLELEPAQAMQPVRVPANPRWTEIGRLPGPLPVTLSEPNVLLLDQAEWRFDEGAWQPREELLRIENHARAFWRLPAKEGNIAQPWADGRPIETTGHVTLRMTIDSDVAVAEPRLALENPAITEVSFDGQQVPSADIGWWVDEAIRTIALPGFAAGTHELTLRLPVTRATDLEWCYLLGDFGVRVAGSTARLVAPVRELAFGDWVPQGLPFYAGNVTYHARLTGVDGPMAVSAPSFKSPLVTVSLDGARKDPIAFAPFESALGHVDIGEHALDLTAFGNRYNAFGPLHNTDRLMTWFGPGAWRTEGDRYAYEYQLKPMGILAAPIVKRNLD